MNAEARRGRRFAKEGGKIGRGWFRRLARWGHNQSLLSDLPSLVFGLHGFAPLIEGVVAGEIWRFRVALVHVSVNEQHQDAQENGCGCIENMTHDGVVEGFRMALLLDVLRRIGWPRSDSAIFVIPDGGEIQGPDHDQQIGQGIHKRLSRQTANCESRTDLPPVINGSGDLLIAL